MVKRYNTNVHLSDGVLVSVGVRESAGGEYVLASDCDTLRRERDALLRVVNAGPCRCAPCDVPWYRCDRCKALDTYRAEFGGDECDS